jgi:zinc/manganese transport system permease protein
MTEFLQIMSLPFAACLILAGIHAYLGLHVIEREVIFVDLALAQIAALGGAAALLFGRDMGSPVSYWLSLGFTLVGATVFALTRHRRQIVPQEAVIGIAYAVSAAAMVLLLSRSGKGDEHIWEALVGNILLVESGDVLKILMIYSAAGIFHFIFRERFMLISRDPDAAYAKGWNIRFWDFLFYASFGFVVTSSVQIAGVLLVFTFLVVPAAAAVLFHISAKSRLLFGWTFGFLGSALGVALSYFFDLPTGAAIVCTFGTLLAMAAVFRSLFRK